MISHKRRNKIQDVVNQRQQGLVVVLEDIHDPHNAAAVLRSCEGFGVQDVYFIFENQEKFNPRKVGKLSSGASNKWLTFHIFNSTEECLSELHEKGYAVYATILDNKAQSLYETDFQEEKIALLFGNEHSGITEKAARLSDHTMYIPMRGFVQSFNLSVTASICLFEVTRQRVKNNMLKPFDKAAQQDLLEDFLKR